jgi:hypothetical protein
MITMPGLSPSEGSGYADNCRENKTVAFDNARKADISSCASPLHVEGMSLIRNPEAGVSQKSLMAAIGCGNHHGK